MRGRLSRSARFISREFRARRILRSRQIDASPQHLFSFSKSTARLLSPSPWPEEQHHNNESARARRASSALRFLCSRLLGLVREIVVASLFGASRNLDAFLTAFRAPNMLRDLFAEGALSTAFVTTFSKKIQTEGDQSAWGLANKIATLTTIFMSIVVLIGIAIAPILVSILAPGFDAEKAALTVVLARTMYPFILLVSLAALVMGMLNAKHVFGMPAMASSFFNIGSIVGGVSIG